VLKAVLQKRLITCGTINIAFHVRAAEEEQLIGSAPLRDDAWDENERREPPLLGAKLTGYRLLNVGVILIFGVSKVALGLSSALATLDWVAGVSLAIILYWVGQLKIRSERHPRWLLFFDVDWAPEILEAMKSVEVSSAPLDFVLYFNKPNGLAQDRRPAEPQPGTFLQVANWSLSVPVYLLRRNPYRHYVSTLTIALLYIALPCLERSLLFLVP